MRFIIALLLNGLVVYLTASLMPGVTVGSFLDAIIVALLLAIVNTFIKPILTFLTLPITILTLGIFLLVINGAMVLLVDWLLDGFHVDGLIWAVFFSLIISLLNLLIGGFDLKGGS